MDRRSNPSATVRIATKAATEAKPASGSSGKQHALRIVPSATTQPELEGHVYALLISAFEAVSAKLLFVNRDRRVAIKTRSAEHYLDHNQRLSVSGGVIKTPVQFETCRIARAIEDVISGLEHTRTLQLPALDDGRRALQLSVHALPPGPRHMSFTPAAVVVLDDRSESLHGARAILMKEYALTAAEADIAVTLAEGRPRAAIASLRQVSIATIRTQMKTIYGKLGVSREAELVARTIALGRGS